MASSGFLWRLLFVPLLFLLYQAQLAHASSSLAIHKRDITWRDITLRKIMDESLFQQHPREAQELSAKVAGNEYNGWVTRERDINFRPTVLAAAVDNTDRALHLFIVYQKNINSIYWGTLTYKRLSNILSGEDNEFREKYEQARKSLFEDKNTSLRSRLEDPHHWDGIRGGGRAVGIIYAPYMDAETRMEILLHWLWVDVDGMLEEYDDELELRTFRYRPICNRDNCRANSDSDSDEDEDEDNDCISFDGEVAHEPDMTDEPLEDQHNPDGPVLPEDLAIAYRNTNMEEKLWEWTMFLGSVDSGRTPAFPPREFTYIKRKSDPLE